MEMSTKMPGLHPALVRLQRRSQRSPQRRHISIRTRDHPRRNRHAAQQTPSPAANHAPHASASPRTRPWRRETPSPDFRILTLHVLAAPIVAALFVNSPIAEGGYFGVMSRRMQYWRKFDPRRCDVLSCALKENASVLDVVDWAIDLPMIYRHVEGGVRLF